MNPFPRLPWFDAASAQLLKLPARGTHALLLYGARGIGKKSLALDLAHDLLCESPQADGSACTRCAGCHLFAAGNHPDLRVVVPDTLAAWRGIASSEDDEAEAIDAAAEETEDKRESREIRIEQVRELSDFFGVATHRGGWRVVMLAPADALNGAAANAALKTLEEPPPQTAFILTTDALDDVLPTVRSRCQLFAVATPLRDVAEHWLGAHGTENPAARLAAAGGAPLEALDEAQNETAAPVLAALMRWLEEGGRSGLGAVGALKIPKAFAAEWAIRAFQRWAWDLSANRLGAEVRYHPGATAVLKMLSDRVHAPERLRDWQQQLMRLRRECHHPALNAKALIEEALIGYRRLFSDTSLRG